MQQQTNTCAQIPRAEQIAQLNDTLRKTGTGGTVVVTRGVMNLTGFDMAMLIAEVASYSEFDPDNDPHGERDFGDLTLFGENLLFKVDYFDRDMEFGSNDPADPEVTVRVLTVLLAREW